MRPSIKEICNKSMEDALREEVMLMLEGDVDNTQKFVNNELTCFDFPLTVGYDMGWNKRSSGNIYNSISGHGTMVGGYTKKVLQYSNVRTYVRCVECFDESSHLFVHFFLISIFSTDYLIL